MYLKNVTGSKPLPTPKIKNFEGKEWSLLPGTGVGQIPHSNVAAKESLPGPHHSLLYGGLGQHCPWMVGTVFTALLGLCLQLARDPVR